MPSPPEHEPEGGTWRTAPPPGISIHYPTPKKTRRKRRRQGRVSQQPSAARLDDDVSAMATSEDERFQDASDVSTVQSASEAETDPEAMYGHSIPNSPRYDPKGLQPTPAARPLAGPTVHMILEGYVSTFTLSSPMSAPLHAAVGSFTAAVVNGVYAPSVLCHAVCVGPGWQADSQQSRLAVLATQQQDLGSMRVEADVGKARAAAELKLSLALVFAGRVWQVICRWTTKAGSAAAAGAPSQPGLPPFVAATAALWLEKKYGSMPAPACVSSCTTLRVCMCLS